MNTDPYYGDLNGTYSRVIADSIAENGIRLSTIELQAHRFVLSELNTHRVFSRNSASSRAIPVWKNLQQVIENPAMPLSWGKEQSGMQAGEELTGERLAEVQDLWRTAAANAVSVVRQLTATTKPGPAGEELPVDALHKSVANRLLEPFLWHKVIVTATDWEGFFEQRISPLAQAEIRVPAELTAEAMYASEPVFLGANEWHLPYVGDDDLSIVEAIAQIANTGGHTIEDLQPMLARISAARCARVSYLTHDGKRSIDADLELYDRLVSAAPAHWSPLEHVARPVDRGALVRGNFRGWVQLRHDADPYLPQHHIISATHAMLRDLGRQIEALQDSIGLEGGHVTEMRDMLTTFERLTADKAAA